ncbi:MAG TPA: SUMF1/EgtB/PvdO family nonheme iron enzyme [Ideonella sp.]|uniref:formylglycine-generating enzyme family protein n=1 Tax=Ideonella sp. TaxID=1929293 RepID=UPI002E355330|nr:SUMF1/EgtB/PvdO family nonheme iron enzyme [Ideonella sp.]HEX5685858.1 SUMF1/EgtB/PvdO family nonheme iron enzyme [Ideonella sp.]
MRNPLVHAYIDNAVRFRPRTSRQAYGPPLRVATTLLTCETAVALLNEIGLPPEGELAYRYVNVHNPRCPLVCEPRTRRWTCVPAQRLHPVSGINWAGAKLLAQQLGGRLPLCAEWEAVASNNEPTRLYPWGDLDPTPALANFDEHMGGTSAVGSFPATDLGLYDLAGNLSEWCEDRLDEQAGGLPGERVIKGGAWSKGPHHLRIAAVRGKWARLGTTTIGIRPVWDD